MNNTHRNNVTDLAHNTGRLKFKQAKKTRRAAGAGECVITSGEKMIGQASFVGPNHKAAYTFPVGNIQFSEAVVKIFSVYVGAKSKQEYSSEGTGFFIAENVIATAYHVVIDKDTFENEDFENGEIGHLSSISFCTSTDCRPLECNELKLHKATLLPLQTKKDENEFYEIHEGNETQVQTKKQWDHSNDFAFLTTEYSSKNYLLPKIFSANGECTVVGYPAFISCKDFARKYTEHSKLSKLAATELYSQVSSKFNGFDNKCVSFGKFEHRAGEPFVYHKAPTLGGTSGGAVVVEDNFFSGVHVGGDVSMENNYFIPISRESFQKEYQWVINTCAPALLETSEVKKFLSNVTQP